MPYSLTHRIKNRIQNSIPRRLIRLRDFITARIACPNGLMIEEDMRRRLPKETLRVVFDVGAHLGQFARDITTTFTESTVFAFEPDPETFSKLSATTPRGRIHTFNIGLGSQNTEARFDLTATNSSMRRIASDQSDTKLPLVKFSTLDTFCSEHNIDHIDYVKIDTEGHDFEVIKGANGLLMRNGINLIEAECAINRDNRFHAPFFEVHTHMEDLGYRLFGLYEQGHEWPSRSPHLRRVNAVFISPVVIDRNRAV